jgi:predicted DsbA family dithiol-disulfide isomerase
MQKLRVDIWSDIACPWCHVGKRRFEAALAKFAHKDEVEIVWRAFELDPSAKARSVPEGSNYAERLAKKYGMPVPMAEQRIQQLVDTAAGEGLAFRFDRIKPGNTFDAHRVVHFALEKGKQDAVKEKMLSGYLEHGAAIGDKADVAKLAVDAGLDADEVTAVLESDAHAEDVRADEREAAELGVTGVPFFVIGRYALSGAQPKEVFQRALDLAWKEHAQASLQPFGEGAACGPDGCAV